MGYATPGMNFTSFGISYKSSTSVIANNSEESLFLYADTGEIWEIYNIMLYSVACPGCAGGAADLHGIDLTTSNIGLTKIVYHSRICGNGTGTLYYHHNNVELTAPGNYTWPLATTDLIAILSGGSIIITDEYSLRIRYFNDSGVNSGANREFRFGYKIYKRRY